MTAIKTKFEIKSWDEKTSLELDGSRKFTRATVALAATEDGFEATGTWEAVMFYAAEDKSIYTGIMHIAGRLGDRSGSFVLAGEGRFSDGTASIEMAIVPGYGTGELAAIRGTATSVSTHADYPFMPFDLDYEIG